MNIQQFQYVLAVAEQRHFETAAEKCFVTQSTLSTMISRFEDEIGIRIFDRKKKPVSITSEGEVLVAQLKTIVTQVEHLQESIKEIKGEVRGNLSIAVIPTIAPFLLPLFLQDFASRFPNLRITVKEQTTGEIMRQIKSRDLDIGILSVPVSDPDIEEYKLYDEPFVYFDSMPKKSKSIKVDSINYSNLCLLEEGHCMRTQVMRLCDMKKKMMMSKLNFAYEAGSIDSLLRFVKANKASTLLPYLAYKDMSEEEKNQVSLFTSPVPFRAIGLVVHRHFVKKRIMNILQEEITSKVKRVLPKLEVKGEILHPL
jgi:LysR family hydrogen peroxide-inducible transcriptional activator